MDPLSCFYDIACSLSGALVNLFRFPYSFNGNDTVYALLDGVSSVYAEAN